MTDTVQVNTMKVRKSFSACWRVCAKAADMAIQAQIASAGSFFIEFCSVSCYSALMEPEIVFVPSAFKHGETRDGIIHAYRTRIHDGLLEDYGNKYGFIGFNRAGNPIEVFYNPIGDDAIKVFHAMDYRDEIIAQIEH